jgi:hypothetical protein
MHCRARYPTVRVRGSGVAVCFNVEAAIFIEKGKVVEICRLVKTYRPLTFRFKRDAFHFRPHLIFQWTIIEKVIDLFGLFELGPGGRNKHQSPGPVTGNGGFAFFQFCQVKDLVRSSPKFLGW